jgi:hypothetical protein
MVKITGLVRFWKYSTLPRDMLRYNGKHTNIVLITASKNFIVKIPWLGKVLDDLILLCLG